MLTKRENLLETIRGGNPDRFVNQYEFIDIIMEAPLGLGFKYGETWKDCWGITWTWPEGQLGQFPLHGEDLTVIKDITKWDKYLTVPHIDDSDEAWAPAIERAEKVDRNEQFVAVPYIPGLFEMTHHLLSMEGALTGFYEEPEAMHELIDALTERELEYAKLAIEKIKPDAMFHHDDWGSQTNSFISPKMFEEFYVPSYTKIYNFYKENGVELIVHHCDCYAANLVPYMIDMGIDIWQGVMNTNNIPELIEKYGGQITFMGGLHSGEIDVPNWTRENVAKHVEEACRTNGKEYFIPSLVAGLPMSSFEGVFEAVNEEIDKMSEKMF